MHGHGAVLLTFLLSVKAGLRAKEIASLTWAMVTDAECVLTEAISFRDAATKGRRGRSIPLNKELRIDLEALKAEAATAIRPSPFVITTER